MRLQLQNREQQLHKEVLGYLLSLTEAWPLMMVYRRWPRVPVKRWYSSAPPRELTPGFAVGIEKLAQRVASQIVYSCSKGSGWMR